MKVLVSCGRTMFLVLAAACGAPVRSAPRPVASPIHNPGFAPEPIRIAPVEPIRLSPEAIDRRAHALANCDIVRRGIEARTATADPVATRVAMTALTELVMLAATQMPTTAGANNAAHPPQNLVGANGVPLGLIVGPRSLREDRARLRAIRSASHLAVTARTDADVIDASDRLIRLCIDP